ncbi:MAG TPA: LD-carboxypeptidase [Woeseiaceae bacterium]|nr:LD-carboxypeptidase [Woeseiaceae bacterium]
MTFAKQSIDRRTAMKAVFAAALAGNLGPGKARAASGEQNNEVLKPRRLRAGDTVGIVAPASNAYENDDINFATEIIASLGYKTVRGKYLFERNQYLAGTDEQRAEDVNTMFARDDINAIVCLRGGYGTPRILPYLDYDVIAKNPKVLCGYSDISGILLAVHKKTSLVGFHGPIALGNWSDYTLQEFEKVLVNPAPRTQIAAPPPFETGRGHLDRENRLVTITKGTARGRLVGGNLTLLASLMGTEFEPVFKDRILFLEDVGEAPYRIDRMLTQLRLAGRLRELAGIAIGKFTEVSASSGNTFSINEILRDRCGDLGVPVVTGFMIGHIEDKTTVPIGIEAELNAGKQSLTLLEPAVL